MNKHLLIALTIILALVFRVYNFGHIPPGVTDDESALGYNAYSLLLSGRDQYQMRLPLVFRSLGDFKPPVYMYLTVASVAVFGPS